MKIKNHFKSLKKDWFETIRGEFWKLIGVHLIYLLIIMFVTLFFISGIFAKVSPLLDKTEFLLDFKQSYQSTGEISPAEGTSLLAAGALLKQAIKSSLLLFSTFVIVFIFFKSIKELIIKKTLFNKMVPKKQWFKILLNNFLFIIPVIILIGLMAWFLPTIIFIILSTLLFLLFESLGIVNMSKNLFKWKHNFFAYWFEHYILNLIITLLVLLGFILIMLISNLLILISTGLALSFMLIFLFLLYVKREVILFLILKQLKVD